MFIARRALGESLSKLIRALSQQILPGVSPRAGCCAPEKGAVLSVGDGGRGGCSLQDLRRTSGERRYMITVMGSKSVGEAQSEA